MAAGCWGYELVCPGRRRYPRISVDDSSLSASSVASAGAGPQGSPSVPAADSPLQWTESPGEIIGCDKRVNVRKGHFVRIDLAKEIDMLGRKVGVLSEGDFCLPSLLSSCSGEQILLLFHSFYEAQGRCFLSTNYLEHFHAIYVQLNL